MRSGEDRRRMDRLAELRERRALTLRELAEMSGVAADTINQIELGHRKPRPSTLRKLARALEVSVEEFYREPALPLDEAPSDEGPAKQPVEKPEEAQRIASIHPSTLENEIKFIKSLKEQREAEIEEIKQGTMPRDYWDFHLEADDKYLEIIYQTAGISAFVEEVTSGRRMTDFQVQRLCHEFFRHFSDFLKLTDEAKALNHQRQSDTYVEVVKGTSAAERYMHAEAQKQRSPES
jgi:transcriptional regulator with XRE-family HTH domain